MFKRVRVLEGERVSLVLPEREDAELWYHGLNDLEVQQYLSTWWTILYRENEQEYYESLRKNPRIRYFGICIEKGETLIWSTTLEINSRNRNAEMGIVIFSKEHQDKGYWTESIKLILKYWFEILWLHKIFLNYVDYNKRAWKVYEKCWFKEIGRRKDHWYFKWEYHNMVEMEIMKTEYKELYMKE